MQHSKGIALKEPDTIKLRTGPHFGQPKKAIQTESMGLLSLHESTNPQAPPSNDAPSICEKKKRKAVWVGDSWPMWKLRLWICILCTVNCACRGQTKPQSANVVYKPIGKCPRKNSSNLTLLVYLVYYKAKASGQDIDHLDFKIVVEPKDSPSFTVILVASSRQEKAAWTSDISQVRRNQAKNQSILGHLTRWADFKVPLGFHGCCRLLTASEIRPFIWKLTYGYHAWL